MKRFLLIFMLLVTPVMAVEPDEMLSDPTLEARAQALDNALVGPAGLATSFVGRTPLVEPEDLRGVVLGVRRMGADQGQQHE